MRRAGELCSKQTKWTPYIKGQKVWLEGTHLSTSHPFTKLHPKQFGPFQITEVLGPVTYRLSLPVTGLGAASRAGAHVSCATGQESANVSVYESGIPPL
jgi:hypothetical protein